MAPDGSGVRHLAWGYDPSWSLDGARLAFRAGTPSSFGHTVVEVVSASGGQSHRVVRTGPSPLTARRPTWSPDGTEIAFATYRGIMTVNADDAKQPTAGDTPRSATRRQLSTLQPAPTHDRLSLNAAPILRASSP